MKKYCDVCGALFEAKGSYQRKCLECWKQEHNAQLRKEGYDDGFQAGYREGRRQVETFDQDFLLDLLRLCHPDRHPPERGALATRISAQINHLRVRNK